MVTTARRRQKYRKPLRAGFRSRGTKVKTPRLVFARRMTERAEQHATHVIEQGSEIAQRIDRTGDNNPVVGFA